jgi:hypothetical protein
MYACWMFFRDFFTKEMWLISVFQKNKKTKKQKNKKRPANQIHPEINPSCLTTRSFGYNHNLSIRSHPTLIHSLIFTVFFLFLISFFIIFQIRNPLKTPPD